MFTRNKIAARLAQPAFKPQPGDRRVAPPLGSTQSTPAAVLVPLVPRQDGITVLLTQRTAHLKHHPSHISFPGGRVESADRERTETALRETQEEIGLAREHIEIIGTLPDYEVTSGFRISPVVAWVEPPFELELDAFEVDSSFEVPLSIVLNPASYQHHDVHFDGKHREYVAIPYQGYYIWGATAAILYTFYRQLTDEPCAG